MPTLAPTHERRLLWLLALTQFTVIMDFMVMMPLGPQIMHTFGIGPAAFATAVSVYSLCSGASGLLAATYVDRFDRRRLLLTVYGLFTLANLACALANSYPLLLAARAFAGLTGGVLGSVVMAILSDVVPPARRGAATGVVMSSFALAAMAGVPVGIALGAHLGWSAPFVLLTGMTALIWLGARHSVPSLTAHLSGTSQTLGQILTDLWQLLTNPRHLRAFLLTFVMMGSMGSAAGLQSAADHRAGRAKADQTRQPEASASGGQHPVPRGGGQHQRAGDGGQRQGDAHGTLPVRHVFDIQGRLQQRHDVLLGWNDDGNASAPKRRPVAKWIRADEKKAVSAT